MHFTHDTQAHTPLQIHSKTVTIALYFLQNISFSFSTFANITKILCYKALLIDKTQPRHAVKETRAGPCNDGGCSPLQHSGVSALSLPLQLACICIIPGKCLPNFCLQLHNSGDETFHHPFRVHQASPALILAHASRPIG